MARPSLCVLGALREGVTVRLRPRVSVPLGPVGPYRGPVGPLPTGRSGATVETGIRSGRRLWPCPAPGSSSTVDSSRVSRTCGVATGTGFRGLVHGEEGGRGAWEAHEGHPPRSAGRESPDLDTYVPGRTDPAPSPTCSPLTAAVPRSPTHAEDPP
ncbi:hypothetical protein Snoj_39080 [Streptomyces nojiriensis]|uniref:Uncharacterized protein n=1 Tax=Streptomyces nojiriensis TaxID=66374 RepID=A0ABQ3SQ99_9ACTN|nr:hypothetical protein Snoj_39080 [Streptomyces nojiriensis]